MQWLGVLFIMVLTLGVVTPVGAWGPNDSEAPGSVIVFPKFVRGVVETPDQACLPTTQFEISVTCPKGSSCLTSGQEVLLRALWVCPGGSDPADPSRCAESAFTLATTVNGTLVFSPEDVSTTPLCDRGYLIAWVVDNAGNAIKFDGLIGDAVIRESPTSARAYNALPIQAAKWLQTGDPTDANGDGALAFDGNEYRAITGKIFGTVRYESSSPDVRTSLTLLTLDVLSNRPNNPTFVDLNFYSEDERMISASTSFTCWSQVRLTDINPDLTTVFANKGLVESAAAAQDTGPVTLVAIAETIEGVELPVTAPALTLDPIIINLPPPAYSSQLTLPPGCVQRTVGIGMNEHTRIKCTVMAPEQLLGVPLVREYAYSLYNDSTSVPTIFAPSGAGGGGGPD
ncbi:MAG: hypothetical protein DME12_00290 [Candidatus Rokuibacteriota bacterium]|nr:MAG: hypothetical protein DME12_00290 [Candidatus Rokubacteria bacterium]PYM62000.1 MAG: hypothetical protein DME11_21370 [Candidatus Rokubacteria bacterium]